MKAIKHFTVSDQRHPEMNKQTILCTYENRLECLPCLAVWTRTVQKYAPDFFAIIFVSPELEREAEFLASSQSGRVRVVALRPKLDGWSIKPEVLLETFRRYNCSRVVWLDSDLACLRSIINLINSLEYNSVYTAQSLDAGFDASFEKTRFWDDKPGRKLSHEVNSCFVSFSRKHTDIIGEWGKRLADIRYLEGQEMHWSNRPKEIFTDQEVLEGVLAGTSVDCLKDSPVVVLRSKLDLVHDCHFGSLGLIDRVRLLLGLRKPYFVHLMGTKPWNAGYKWLAWTYTRPYVAYAIHVCKNPSNDYEGYWKELLRSSASTGRFPLLNRLSASLSIWFAGIPVRLFNMSIVRDHQ